MNMNEIFLNVKESFCSLWTFKVRGNTLEIITPYSTTNSKFISVFITRQREKFIVTDGSWLLKGEYEIIPDLEDEIFMKIFNHYETSYDINKLEDKSGIFYYKFTLDIDLIPNLVYEMTNFLSSVLSASQIQFIDPREKEEKERFGKIADSYLSSLIDKGNIKFRKELGENYKTVRFNAIITTGSKISLVKYITGSTPNYFLSSLTKATVDFEIANHSHFNDYILNRVALVDDIAPGFVEGKLYRYLETLEEHTKIPSVKWTQKELLTSIL